jgi:hypothetical protein
MKLVKLVSNPDWIRFSKDLEVKVNNMITAKVNATGELNTIRTSLGDFVTFEDIETDIDYYLNGEELKREGFKELYTKLFKTTTFDDLEDSIYDFCEFELKNKNANHIGHLNKSTRIKILNELIETCPRTHHYGSTVLRQYWQVNTLLRTFGKEFVVSSERFSLGGPEYTYGLDLTKVLDMFDKIQIS